MDTHCRARMSSEQTEEPKYREAPSSGVQEAAPRHSRARKPAERKGPVVAAGLGVLLSEGSALWDSVSCLWGTVPPRVM